MITGRTQKQFIYRKRLAVSIAFVFFLALFSNAEHLPVKTYTVADGLLRDNVYKIKQDSRGFLWFCTVEGISRFDGYTFENFTIADGLPDRHVNDFLETKDGSIYIATGRGLAKLNPTGIHHSIREPKSESQKPNKSLFTVEFPDNSGANEINYLFEDESGHLFAGTSNGLYKLNESGKLEVVNLVEPSANAKPLPVTSIIQDRRGALWIGTLGNGLFRLLPNGESDQFTEKNGLPDINISALHEDKNNRLWVGLSPNKASGLLMLVAQPEKNQNIVERHYREKEGLPADWITDLYETSDGQLLVATTHGLCLWKGGENTVCKIYTSANDLCDAEIWSITEDKDKNLWLGTRCGAKKWTRYGFTTYTEADGTGYPLVNSIFENSAGDLFASFNNGTQRTISRFDGEKFEFVKPNYPSKIIYSGWGWKQTVWQDRGGDWWIPTGAGLLRFPKPARFTDLSKISPQKIVVGTKETQVFRFFEDSHGDIWVATSDTVFELWHWQRTTGTWQNFTQELEIGKNRIAAAFVEDKAGNLWIGTLSESGDASLSRYRDGQFRTFTRNENELLAGSLRDLFIDHTGRLWIANPTSGLLRLDDVNENKLNLTRYTPAEGLSSIAVLCITEDAFGRIYVGTGRGLDRLNPETGQIENFTTADGLPNSDVEIAYRDRRNNLWFGTANGLARFVPAPTRRRQAPNIFITGLRVSGVSQAVSILGEAQVPALALDADQRQVTIDFLGLGASLGEKLKYEYRFGDSDWTVTDERTVNFANLSAGEYQFQVRAQTADRIFSNSPATVSFRIAAPLWQRWWFILLISALTALIIYTVYRNQLTRLLQMERMRTRIATDLHDDIGTNLTKISILSEVVKQQNAHTGQHKLLTLIADISRESVAAMGDIVWAINPNKDSLLDVARRMRGYAEEICEQSDLRLKFFAPEMAAEVKLEADIRRNVYLIFKESLNNIVCHSKASAVEITFGVERHCLVLSVGDDGVGFPTEQEFNGNGLLNMKKRAVELNGKLQVISTVGSGTNIVLQIPLESKRKIWK